MSPFAPSQPNSQPAATGGAGFRPAWLVFFVCLLLGLGAVGWHAKHRAERNMASARTEALARGAALEGQFNQAISAAEVLGVLVRQGSMADFQKVASDLLASRPGLASLELQPGGVVSDIVPRPGNERVIGFNALKDPAYGPGAAAALQTRALTIAGPLKLYSGEPGFVVRLPIYQRGREGCWGFVACAVRIPQLIARARLDELPRRGFDYALLVTNSPGQKMMTAALQGTVYMEDAVMFPIRVQNLELRLALQPRAGWYNTASIMYEALGALFISGFFCLLVNMMESRRDVEAALTEMNRKLAREASDRKQAQEESRGAKDEAAASLQELKRTRTALEQTQPAMENLQAELAAAKTAASEMLQTAEEQAKSKMAELQGQFQAELDMAEQSARAKEAELDQAQANLHQAQQSITELQARLAAAGRAEKQAAAAAQKRSEQDQATIADLQTRLDAASKGAGSALEATERKLKQAEKANADLRERLAVAEQAEGQVQELTELLKEADAELKRAHAAMKQAEPIAQPAPLPAADAVEKSADIEVAPISSKTVEVASDEPAKKDPAPVGVEAHESANLLATAEPSVERKPAKAPKRKKRGDAQMDLFGEPAAEASAAEVAPSLPADAVLEEEPVETSESVEADAEVGVRIGSNPDSVFESVLEEELEKNKEPSLKDEKAAKRYAASGPVDEAELRKAVHEIVPLFVEKDPGAKDCLKANRNIFKSAFTSDGYQEFEQAVKGSDFAEALEILRKVARKHGISA